MKKTSFNVQKEFCLECQLAIRKFLPRLKGILSIETGDGIVEITYDESTVNEKEVLQIAKDSIERLGYKTVNPVK